MQLDYVRVIGTLFVLYAVFVLLVAGCQRQMLYFPSQSTEAHLLQVADRLGLQPWRSHEGDVVGWKRSGDPDQHENRIAVVFHGNAGYALNRGYFVDALSERSDVAWQVFLFEYPGYGARTGKPSAAAFKEKAAEALKQLLEREPSHLMVIGESIGSGPASYLAGRFPDAIDSLLLVTPFDSLHALARRHYPFLPVDLMLRERFDNADALQSYNGRVGVLLAGQDDVVPTVLGQRLFDAYDGPKKLWIQESRGHNTLDYRPDALWWQEWMDFIRN